MIKQICLCAGTLVVFILAGNTQMKIAGSEPLFQYVNQEKSLKQKSPIIFKPEYSFEIIDGSRESSYTEEELDMLSRIIFAEAGSDCISDEHQQLVGAVVMNRVADPRFPNTIKEVIWEKGQYACIDNGTYYLEPSERAIKNAKKVLCGEVVTPPDMVYQAEFVQGEVYKSFDTPWSTTYFCLG